MPRAFLKAPEPFSSYSHFIGAVLSGAGLFVLLVRLLFDSSVTGSLAAAAAEVFFFGGMLMKGMKI